MAERRRRNRGLKEIKEKIEMRGEVVLAPPPRNHSGVIVLNAGEGVLDAGVRPRCGSGGEGTMRGLTQIPTVNIQLCSYVDELRLPNKTSNPPGPCGLSRLSYLFSLSSFGRKDLPLEISLPRTSHPRPSESPFGGRTAQKL